MRCGHTDGKYAKSKMCVTCSGVEKKQYVKDNPEKIRAQKKNYRDKNREKVNAYKRNYENEKRATNLQHKLSADLRTRIRLAIKGNQKVGSAVRDLGCTVVELIAYLEAQFKPGMSWENWSIKGWHIDHIKPLSSFDLSDRDQFLIACNYKNLQPLWAHENYKKGNKIL